MRVPRRLLFRYAVNDTRGYYLMLYTALQQWMVADFPFRKPYCSNLEMPSTA